MLWIIALCPQEREQDKTPSDDSSNVGLFILGEMGLKGLVAIHRKSQRRLRPDYLAVLLGVWRCALINIVEVDLCALWTRLDNCRAGTSR